MEAEHHLIATYDVVMVGSDREQLATMVAKPKDAMGVEKLDALADHGYFSGEEIRSREALGVTPYLPKPLTSGAKAEGRFGKQDFVNLPEQDVYRCPSGAQLQRHILAMVRWGMPSSRKAQLDAATKRADKLRAKGKEVDFDQLLRMEPDSGTTNVHNTSSAH
ncbi:mobile element protein [Bosea sp. BIWAKO-01]|nr:mobile element protein [Bosea sp. BIWAKO-01]